MTHPSSWNEVPRRERRRIATSLVVSMEDTGFHIADSLDAGDPPVISRDENICKIIIDIILDFK